MQQNSNISSSSSSIANNPFASLFQSVSVESQPPKVDTSSPSSSKISAPYTELEINSLLEQIFQVTLNPKHFLNDATNNNNNKLAGFIFIGDLDELNNDDNEQTQATTLLGKDNLDEVNTGLSLKPTLASKGVQIGGRRFFKNILFSVFLKKYPDIDQKTFDIFYHLIF
jgi:hypothetical protein